MMMSLHHLTTPSPLQNHSRKPHHLPAAYTSRRTRRWTSIRSSSSGDSNAEKASENDSASSKRVDRRNVLLGLGGLYGAAGLGRQALASPVQIPDMSACSPAQSDTNPGELKCCPPAQVSEGNIVKFQFPSGGQLRVRKPAQEMSDEEVNKFKRAIQLMRELPADDPWSFEQQAKVHCAFCNKAYKQVGFNDVPLQVHFSWLFLPWHRWYLYFFERILGKLINDDSVALPFWNYDRPEAMYMPTIYKDPNSSLYNPRRNPDHYDMLIDFNYSYDSGVPDKDVVQANLVELRTMFDNSIPIADLFMGDELSAGELTQDDNSSGALERFHNVLHMWTGHHSSASPDPYLDMGDFSTAAKDPLFYAHHSNIDRLWHIYRARRGQKVEFNKKDWLDAEFIFYDENRKVVKVNVKDSLNATDLGYTYKEVPTPWMQKAPPKRPKAKTRSGSSSPVLVSEFGTESRVLDGAPLRVLVKRPKTNRGKEEKEDEHEVLYIDGIEITEGGPVRFDVYIAVPIENFARPELGYIAGSFVKLPHTHKADHKTKLSKLKLGITGVLEALKAEDAEKLVVTLVPRTGRVNIGGVHVELLKTDN